MNTPLEGPAALLIGAMLAATPFIVIAALLWLAAHRERARDRIAARQIALTDALHRQVGALVAPTVRKPIFGPWQVLIPVPLNRPDAVGRVLAVVNDAVAAIDRRMARDVRIVLTPREETR